MNLFSAQPRPIAISLTRAGPNGGRMVQQCHSRLTTPDVVGRAGPAPTIAPHLGGLARVPCDWLPKSLVRPAGVGIDSMEDDKGTAMNVKSLATVAIAGSFAMLLAACGGPSTSTAERKAAADAQRAAIDASRQDSDDFETETSKTIWGIFGNQANPNTTVAVNRYLWQASLEVLNFLPVESVDPFTGVIVTGYGTPPGGGRSYRATIYVSDPALDARSLKVSLQGRGGAAVAPETQRAVEDAILTRARAIRVRDSKL